jgi:hypothetical protein
LQKQSHWLTWRRVLRKQSTRTQRSFWKSDSKWRYPSRKGHMCSTFVQMNKAHKWLWVEFNQL